MLHLDVVGPLEQVGQSRFLLTMIDRTTRMFEVAVLSSISAEEVARALITSWFVRYGLPRQLVSDRGSNFMSSLFNKLCLLLGVSHTPTTAYHPSCNGVIERFHRRLKAALRAHLAGPNWPDILPWVCLGLRAAPRDLDDVSAFEACYGSTPTLPSMMLDRPESAPAEIEAALRKHREGLPVRPPSPVDVNVPPDLRWVFVREDGARTPLAPLYRGPFKVLRQTRNCVVLQMGDKVDSVTLQRIKPYRVEGDVEVAVLPRRGRPPGGRRVATGCP